MSSSGVEAIVNDYFARLRRALAPLPKPACDYPSLELNAAAKEGPSRHDLGFGSCVAGKLVEITASQGIWTVGR
jgi:hypothetical protein